MELWRAGALETPCKCSDVEDLGARCKRADLETWRYGALEASGRCEGMEAWSSGALARCRRVDVEVEVRSEGALEVRCWRVGVET